MSFDLADFRYQYADSGCISRLPLTLCNDATNAKRLQGINHSLDRHSLDVRANHTNPRN